MSIGRGTSLPRGNFGFGRTSAVAAPLSTPEVPGGAFLTTYSYSESDFEYAMLYDVRRDMTSEDGRVYTISVSAVRPAVTGVIVAIGGKDIAPTSRPTVRLENKDGFVHVQLT
jgi:hypothetical protein